MALGMKVVGTDPFLSVGAALRLDPSVTVVKTQDDVFAAADYLTIHVPFNKDTECMINAATIAKMKDGVRALNYARGELVNDEDMKAALDSGKVAKYMTDFPNPAIAGYKNVVAFPHLGASTAESEDNCAVMAVKELRDYLENGNIVHSVNFPDCSMGACTASGRVGILHKNVKGMIGQITTALAEADINVSDLTNKGKGDYAYSLLDLDSAIDASTVEKLSAIDGVLRVRVIK